MVNRTIDVLNVVFIMGKIDLSSEGKYLTVLIGSLVYLFTLFSNLSLLAVIVFNRNLHGPMYLFLLNLSINDLIGISAMIPRVMSDVLSEDRHITYPACLIQAFCIHMYGGATLLILSIMSFDRYIAICHPLRYHSIMTKNTVVSLIASAWLIDFLLVGILFGLTLRFPVCKTVIVNIYCDNISLLRLTCATETTVNNVYGLFITGVLHGGGAFSVVFSYSFILFTCFRGRDSDAKLKALHTCATHLLVFLIYEFSGIIVVLVYRIPNTPLLLQTFAGMIFVIFPPGLNPVIYGIKTKKIRVKLLQLFSMANGSVRVVKVNSVT
ncbi:olfactory receptor 52D1-like [Oncorhynchus masou masou]|uniref:olfactory receptor 52D1-like n=1 Tax=Oncorhynchus masou masou TaxID=90313 RepID=UPI0031835086